MKKSIKKVAKNYEQLIKGEKTINELRKENGLSPLKDLEADRKWITDGCDNR